jgi:hypothetical protein
MKIISATNENYGFKTREPKRSDGRMNECDDDGRGGPIQSELIPYGGGCTLGLSGGHPTKSISANRRFNQVAQLVKRY